MDEILNDAMENDIEFDIINEKDRTEISIYRRNISNEKRLVNRKIIYRDECVDAVYCMYAKEILKKLIGEEKEYNRKW